MDFCVIGIFTGILRQIHNDLRATCIDHCKELPLRASPTPIPTLCCVANEYFQLTAFPQVAFGTCPNEELMF
jgi:hypothetical protein